MCSRRRRPNSGEVVKFTADAAGGGRGEHAGYQQDTQRGRAAAPLRFAAASYL